MRRNKDLTIYASFKQKPPSPRLHSSRGAHRRGMSLGLLPQTHRNASKSKVRKSKKKSEKQMNISVYVRIKPLPRESPQVQMRLKHNSLFFLKEKTKKGHNGTDLYILS